MRAIRYFSYEEVDREKWDACVLASPNGFIYARSFYLDGLCRWDALVMGDYEYLMPLPVRKKYGFRYIYTPPFTGQLGIIGTAPVTEDIIHDFVNHIPPAFSYVDLMMNEENEMPAIKGVKNV